MKQRISILLAVLFPCLLLTACGGNDSISGEVVDIHQDPETGTALILQTDGGKRAAVFLDDGTYVFGMDGVDGEAYKASPRTGIAIYFFPEGRKTTLTTADGEKLKAYHADRYISIDAYLVPDAVNLSDGTPLDAWKSSFFGTTYCLQDGTELLREDAPSGPKNHYVESLESFDDLSEAAKPLIQQYYDGQGTLYDLQAELEKAWAEYRENPETFSTHYVSQNTSPSASSERVMYFNTNLTLPVSGQTVEEFSYCAAFDRETGEEIPLAELFTCRPSEIAENLLALAEKDGSFPSEPEVKREMTAAFQMEYLSFYSDGVFLNFPAGSLPSQEYAYLVSVDYDAGLSDILQPWAIPQSRTE